MNELVEVVNGVKTCSQNDVAKQIMTVFRAVTPQFYKSMTDNELRAELLSIKLLSQDIDQDTLAEMCRLAVKGYAAARSSNSRTYFDMNYILTFYVEAFNNVHCYGVELPKGAKLKENSYDEETKTVTEIWEADNREIEIKCIRDKEVKKTSRTYSPRFFENLFTE